jgi:hypothetical protein
MTSITAVILACPEPFIATVLVIGGVAYHFCKKKNQ